MQWCGSTRQNAMNKIPDLPIPYNGERPNRRQGPNDRCSVQAAQAQLSLTESAVLLHLTLTRAVDSVFPHSTNYTLALSISQCSTVFSTGLWLHVVV